MVDPGSRDRSSGGGGVDSGEDVSDDEDRESWMGTPGVTGRDGGQKQQGGGAHSVSSRRNSYTSNNMVTSNVNERLSTGGWSDRQDQQQPSPSNKTHHPRHHHHHHHNSRTSAGTASGSVGTPSRALSERLSLDGFDGPNMSQTASTALGEIGGNNRTGTPSPIGGNIRPSAPSPPPTCSSSRSSMVGNGARGARGAERVSPSVSSPRSLSPSRRGGGGGDGGGGAGGSTSPKKQIRRSTDSQMLGRKSVESQGGVSPNFKVIYKRYCMELCIRI